MHIVGPKSDDKENAMTFLPTVPEDEREVVSTMLLHLLKHYWANNPELKDRIRPKTTGTPMVVLTNKQDPRYYVVLAELIREPMGDVATYRVHRPM